MPGPHASAAELTRLAASPDAALRASVAAHPNTPPPVLAELGAEFPAEVLGNPALPLLRLAQPGLLAGWPAHTLEQFSELRDARNGTPHHSILCFAALQVRPAQCFALALCELSQSARQKDVASFCQML
ncbi:hypothetical protein [Deinococcus wulumuqiensis]|uniref:hypothetical protein n=1 Tax=Deinococcus wulumuqiensis TaxID=980427 RepID=UPI001F07DE50|nr:hypothetical protein [Deinococcus wulumuqiensis]